MAYVNQASGVADLKRIAVPTLILHGSRDNFFSKKHADALCSGIKDAKLIMIENALHAIPVRMYHAYLPEILRAMGKAK